MVYFNTLISLQVLKDKDIFDAAVRLFKKRSHSACSLLQLAARSFSKFMSYILRILLFLIFMGYRYKSVLDSERVFKIEAYAHL
jgi:hypothetical protein